MLRYGVLTASLISIHALLAESDFCKVAGNAFGRGISIHALLAESDVSDFTRRLSYKNFYPRSPCGERLGQIGGLF